MVLGEIEVHVLELGLDVMRRTSGRYLPLGAALGAGTALAAGLPPQELPRGKRPLLWRSFSASGSLAFLDRGERVRLIARAARSVFALPADQPLDLGTFTILKGESQRVEGLTFQRSLPGSFSSAEDGLAEVFVVVDEIELQR